MILEMVLGLFLTVSGGGKAEVDPTTTILKMLVKGNEIKKEENWLVPVFDRQEGYCLHHKDHPYNPFSTNPLKKERHKKFIDSIFAFDASFKSDLTNLLDELPKVDNQFPYE